MSEVNFIKCSVQGCCEEATREAKQGRRAPRKLCANDYNKLLAYQRQLKVERKAKKLALGLQPHCENKLSSGLLCLQGNTQLWKDDSAVLHSLCPVCYQVKDHNKKMIKKISKRKNYLLNQEEEKLKANFRRHVAWYSNFMVMKTVNPNFNFYTFCDQESRKFVRYDFKGVGLFIENEEGFVKPEAIRQKKYIDAYIEELGWFIETKSSKATFSYSETMLQVETYLKMHTNEVELGYRENKQVHFMSWSPTGDNSDMSLKQFYIKIKNEICGIYESLKSNHPTTYKRRFRNIFKTLNYIKFVELCDLRISQLENGDKYCPSSLSYDSEAIKVEFVDTLKKGILSIPQLDLASLDELLA